MLVREGPPTVRVVEGARQSETFLSPPSVVPRARKGRRCGSRSCDLPGTAPKATGPSRRALLSAFTWTEPGAKARGRRTPVPCRRRSRSGRVTSAGDVSPLRSRSWRRRPRLRTEAGLSRGPRSPRFPRVSIPFPRSRACSPSLRFAVQAPRGRPVPRRPNPPCVRSEAPHAQPPVRFKKQVPVPSGTAGL